MRLASRSALFFLTVTLLAGARPTAAQEGPLENTPPKGTTPEEMITQFAAREKLFKEAREHYTYRQDITVQTRDGETITGEYHEVFDVLYDDKGHRLENVVFAPQSSLEQGGLSLDQGDVQDFRNRLPFVLTTEEVPEYNILYVGQQQEDALHCYVFDIAPKQIVGKKRYFQGRIWVDDHDFQIVKTYGQAVPDTRADDTLHFSTGDIHIREIVKYEDYKRFGSSVKILYQGQEINKADQKDKDQKSPDDPNKNPEQKKPEAAPNAQAPQK